MILIGAFAARSAAGVQVVPAGTIGPPFLSGRRKALDPAPGVGHAMGVLAVDNPAYYGDRWADVYDEEHAGMDPAPTVALLRSLAGDGNTLELGVGTGRVALPLAAAGVRVIGLDTSEAMVARLRSKPEGSRLPVRIGDMASDDLGGPYRLVFVVFSTLFGLLTQQRQLACFANVAKALESSGWLVIECFVPDVARFTNGSQAVRVVSLEDERLRVNASRHDPVNQRISAQDVVLGPNRVDLRPVVIRYAWPSELDLMARLAGLELEDRWGGWAREPFTAQSGQHVSVYRHASS